jgi:hypothetical protein
LRHRPPTACRHAVSGTISLPSQGFFSPFPHGTGSLSVANEYLALPDGPGGFPQGFTCPAVLRSHSKSDCIFQYGAVTLFGRPSQTVLITLSYTSLNHEDSGTIANPCTFVIIVVLQHPILLADHRVWAIPSSLATTFGITVVFSSSGY